jgi:hypothetical protein
MFNTTIIQVGSGIVFIFLKSPIYRIVLQHFIQPQGPASQIVIHDGYFSKWIPYCFSALALKMEGDQVTNDLYIW